MAGRGRDVDEIAAMFEAFADAEGVRIPVYAAMSRIIARRTELAELVLEAPEGQRLAVLLLAALHDVVLRHPDALLAPWCSPEPPGNPTDGSRELEDALLATVDAHRDRILASVRSRQVQTNEVNRCVAWWIGLHHLCAEDTSRRDDRARRDDPARPLALVELGASAGLNLRLDQYAYRFEDPDGTTVLAGQEGSPVQLGTVLRSGQWPDLSRELPPVVGRLGIDRRPVDVADPDDARWLRACVWPEQPERLARLDAAVAAASGDPPTIVPGDLFGDLAALIERAFTEAPEPPHLVVLASWVLAYVPRGRRSELCDTLADLAVGVERRGGRLSMLTLEADHVLPWVDRPALPEGAAAEDRLASILAATRFGGGRVAAEPLARCQAHLVWADQL